MFKWIKRSLLGMAILGGAGLWLFGTDAYSYVRSSSRILQESVMDSVPYEFQIQRARHLLDELVPQMHANIKLIASEEIDVIELETELDSSRTNLGAQKERIQKLRSSVKTNKVSYRFGRVSYSRQDVLEELNRSFENYQTAEVLLASKEKLLKSREQALRSAKKKLDMMKVTRIELDSQIEQLESQFRLVQAESATAHFDLDDSKLNQIHKVLKELRKRLEVSQRVLAHESRFIHNIDVDTLDESTLLETIDDHFTEGQFAEERFTEGQFTGDGVDEKTSL